MAEIPNTFGEDETRRIVDAVRWVERQQKNERNYVRVGPRPGIPLLKGFLDTALQAGGTVDVSIWVYSDSSSEADTTETIEDCHDWLLRGTSGTLPRGSAVIIGFVSGRWYILQLCDRLLGKTDSEIRKGARGWVSIYLGEHTAETDTGDNVLAMNKFADVGSGKWVWVDRTQYGFYLVAAECGDAATENIPPPYTPPEPEPEPYPRPITTDGGGGGAITTDDGGVTLRPAGGTTTAGVSGGSDDGGITYGFSPLRALTSGGSGASGGEADSGGGSSTEGGAGMGG